MKLIYMASPYAGDIEKNTEFAKKACCHVMEQGHAFFAPHLLYPAILDENQPEQRQLGIEMGIAVLEVCDELWCYGDRISQGMMLEIEKARQIGIPILRIMERENVFVIGTAIEREEVKIKEEDTFITMAVGI